jgi:hypothetical protein
MKVLNNNGLVVLLTVAIIASVSGTFLSINFIDDVITGAATTTGNVTITVSSTAGCSATDAIIAFGNLAQNESNNTGGANNDTIHIANTGNTNLDVTAETSVNLFSQRDAPSAFWRISCYLAESGSCNTTEHNVQEASNATSLITSLDFNDGTDDFNVSINVTVPDNETAGAKNGELTFTCTTS